MCAGVTAVKWRLRADPEFLILVDGFSCPVATLAQVNIEGGPACAAISESLRHQLSNSRPLDFPVFLEKVTFQVSQNHVPTQ